MTVKLLAFAGSTRTDSYNQRLVDVATTLARAEGAEVTAIKLREFDLPLFDEDLEKAGFPANADKLRGLFWAHDGFLIATPEYNGGVTGVLKNAIDWASRPVPGDPSSFLRGFRGKVAGVMSTSLTSFGGVRSSLHLRQILGTIQTLVVTENVTVPFAPKAFEDAELVDEAAKAFLAAQVKRVIKVAGALSPRLNP